MRGLVSRWNEMCRCLCMGFLQFVTLCVWPSVVAMLTRLHCSPYLLCPSLFVILRASRLVVGRTFAFAFVPALAPRYGATTRLCTPDLRPTRVAIHDVAYNFAVAVYLD